MNRKWKGNYAGGGAVYGLGLIGALVYYLQHASTFSEGLLGVLKAIVWPALLIYKIIELLKM
ncbi:hypothetical protein A3E46_00430 [Candidatus Woesebacteria bacterium RIFCSPHIGHO2_12_FULL_46_16]|uniref:Uncharacterized protein n=1 Tax=Candidatus Woesebacteria bacterium RIFCSPHIGHO2_12_FULL_46_16 TaxID=1802513 RepID=A0A1F8B1Q7_9BACT|nr:MAG: hypothetical protein A3E46_00430 [Candidatus Woesebacteria bacterium RIFCSPHIGHO2_12_FULL_46_16]